MINITLQQASILQIESSLIVIGFCEDTPLPEQVAALIERSDFAGKAKQSFLLYPREALPARRVLLLGMGKSDEMNMTTIRQAAAIAYRKAQELKLNDFAVHFLPPDQASPSEITQAIVEGAILGGYTFLEYKSAPTEDDTHQVENLTIVIEESSQAAEQGVATGQAIANGVKLARDLANAPGNVLTPARMAEIAVDVGEKTGLEVAVLEGDALNDFGGLIAVGKGSTQTPRFIILEHGKAQSDVPTICLVGKGITFDTGGISLKPGANMDEMKMDMSGAAAVIGTMQVVAETNLPLHIVGLISAAENMPDAHAYKPGDVITTLSKKTVEVLNTDAEGRVVLADALFYAQQYDPQAIIDIATLTGAAVITFGQHTCGVMASDQSLADRLIKAGEITRERVWQLPLWDEYKDMIKSTIADIKNVGGREAGTITAAAFLAEFVGEYPWAHLDIASTAWSEKPTKEYETKGASGFGVRLFYQMLCDWNNA